MNFQNFLTTVMRDKNNERPRFEEGTFSAERRHYPRIRAELPLGYSIVDEKKNHGGMVGDVSEGGLLVYLKERLNVGTRLKLEILFVRGLELSSIDGVARVVRSELTARGNWGEHRYGLQFESFCEGDLDKLKSMLKEVQQTHIH
jgi:hypothetical protein